MINTKEIDPAYLESVFFDPKNKFRFRPSSMKKLQEAPKQFYQEYVLKTREESSERHLVMGTLIHFLVLEHEKFDDRFMLIPEGVPTGKGKDVVDSVYAAWKERQVETDASSEEGDTQVTLRDLQEEILVAMHEHDLYQNFVDDVKAPHATGDEKRLEKIITPKNEEYFKSLIDQNTKIVIDSGMLDKATVAADVIKNDPKLAELLGLGREIDPLKFVAYNELKLEMDLENLPFGLQGTLDNMTVDVEKKLITINDIKTTGASLTKFKDSAEMWGYYYQGAVYPKLAKAYLAEYIDDTWTINFNFIVIDSFNQVYAFPVSEQTAIEWNKRLDEVLVMMNYHFTTRDFTLPYQFATGTVFL